MWKAAAVADFADERRVHHVAEVDDAHDARLIVGCDQHVVEVVVVVDHLRPQRRAGAAARAS